MGSAAVCFFFGLSLLPRSIIIVRSAAEATSVWCARFRQGSLVCRCACAFVCVCVCVLAFICVSEYVCNVRVCACVYVVTRQGRSPGQFPEGPNDRRFFFPSLADPIRYYSPCIQTRRERAAKVHNRRRFRYVFTLVHRPAAVDDATRIRLGHDGALKIRDRHFRRNPTGKCGVCRADKRFEFFSPRDKPTGRN